MRVLIFLVVVFLHFSGFEIVNWLVELAIFSDIFIDHDKMCRYMCM